MGGPGVIVPFLGGCHAAGWIEVDTDELRAAAAGMLGVGDGLHATAAQGVLLGRTGYGDAQLGASARRFADQFAYLVRCSGDDAIDCATAMRGSAEAYDEMDAIAGYTFDGLGPP